MYIETLKENDWKSFEHFVKKNLVKSFISTKKFNSFWFKNKKNWNIQLAKNLAGQIIAINMTIKTSCMFKKKIKNFAWTSTAYANNEARKIGIFALMIIKIHRTFPIVGSLCGNVNSLAINKKLGDDMKGMKLRRYIFIHNSKILKIIKQKYQSKIKKLKFKKLQDLSKKISIKWSKSVPVDINKLWTCFSSQFDLCINKNYKFLKKRYENSPYQNYDFLILRDDKKKLIGFSVIRIQKTKAGKCFRIVEFMSLKKFEKLVWGSVLVECAKKGSVFSDFMVVGQSQDKHLLSTGFKLAVNKNLITNVPNLLSPIEYRDWSYSFHIGGILIKKIKAINSKNKIWFTKGDGDRDWPTPRDI